MPKTAFLDVVATQNDHSTYLNHVLGSIYVFFTLFGYWVPEGGGVSQGIGRHPAYDVFHPRTAQKSQFPKLISLDIVITQIDQPTYVWCVLRLFDEFFTLFRLSVGVGGLGGIPRGLVRNLLVQFFTLESSKITTHKLFDQIQAGPCIWQNATYPPILGLFGPIRLPYAKGLHCWFNPL